MTHKNSPKKTPIIHLARTAGFCFGVKRAIRMAHELAKSGGTTQAPPEASPRRVHMLGDLVHNQAVIAGLENAGIKKITRLGNGRGKTLLIRAHGAGRRLMAQAASHGYKIVDATCPMVRAIHEIVRRMDGKGYRIIVLGDRRHEEVQGIVGQIAGKTLIIDKIKNIPWPQIKKIRKAAIVVQSTQNMDHILPIVTALKGKINEIKFFNTICRPTRMKQAEMKTMPLQHDVVIVIGSRSSANTRRLHEISRALNPRTCRIESAAEIKADWFKKSKMIGITAGASTPQSAIRSVIGRIKELTR